MESEPPSKRQRSRANESDDADCDEIDSNSGSDESDEEMQPDPEMASLVLKALRTFRFYRPYSLRVSKQMREQGRLIPKRYQKYASAGAEP
jgi:hypothetical protein